MGFIFTLFAVVAMLIGALVGYLRGWKKSIIGLGIIVVSFVIALLITQPIARASTSALAPIVEEMVAGELGSESYDQLVESSATTDALIKQLPGALVAPIVMVLIFILVFAIVSCFGPLIRKLIFRENSKSDDSKDDLKEDSKNEETLASDATESTVEMEESVKEVEETVDESEMIAKEKPGKKLIGLSIGLAKGLLFAFILVLPIAGYLGLISSALDAVDLAKSGANDSSEMTTADKEFVEIEQNVVRPLTSDPFVKVVSACGGNAIFNSQSTIRIGTKKYSATKTISNIMLIASDAEPLLSEKLENYSESQVNAINSMSTDFTRDELICRVGSEVISGASKAWLKGDKFLNVERPQIDGYLSGVFDRLLEVYSTMTTETIGSDIQVIADIIKVLIENDAIKEFASNSENSNVLSVLSREGFVSSLVETVYANERMQPVLKEITNVGVLMIADSLGIPADGSAVRDNLVDGITNDVNEVLALENSDEKSSALNKKLKDAFKNNGVDVPEELLPTLCDCVLGSFEGVSEISKEDMIDLFVNMADELSKYSEDKLYMSTSPNTSEKIKNSVSEFKSTIEKGYSITAVRSLSTVSTKIANGKVETSVITAESIAIKMGDISSENLKSEANAIETIAKSASKIVETLKSSDNKDIISNIDADALQEVVKAMNSSELLGGATKELLNGMMESEAFKDNGVIDSSIVEDILNNPDNLSNTVKTAQKTMGILNSLSDNMTAGTDKKEQLTQDIGWLVENMTPDTASLMKKQISEEKMGTFGVPENRAHSVYTVVSSLLDSISAESGLSKEEFEKESDAMVHLYDIAVKLSDETSGSANDLAANASEITEIMLSSKVVSATILKVAYDDNKLSTDPLKVGNPFSDEQKSMFITAMNDYSKKNNSEETAEKILSLSTILNIGVTVSADGTVAAK